MAQKSLYSKSKNKSPKQSKKQLPPTGSDELNLRQTFWVAVGRFNDDNFTSIPNFTPYACATNVAMKRLDDPGKYHEGIDDVRHYFLTTGQAEKAFFMPDSPPDFKVIGARGFVSGTANFIDNTRVSPPTATRRIAYSFTYEKTNEWKAVHLWGKYID